MSGLQLLIIGLSRVTLERHVLAVEIGFTHVCLVTTRKVSHDGLLSLRALWWEWGLQGISQVHNLQWNGKSFSLSLDYASIRLDIFRLVLSTLPYLEGYLPCSVCRP
ncbi:hypothetical protein B0813_001061 [Candidatus Fervidibacteria bacterium JGI MDM2 SSWTFF-3-K9]